MPIILFCDHFQHLYANIMFFKTFNQFSLDVQKNNLISKDLSLDFIHFSLCLPAKIIFHLTYKVSLLFVKDLLSHRCITFASKSLSLHSHCHRLP